MAINDVREFIEVLSKTEDVVTVDEETDWDLELGAICRLSNERGGPGLLFTNIKDYPGYRILGSPIATWRRLAIAMGLRPDVTVKEIYAEWERRESNPIPPKVVSTGPCKENIVKGDKVNLFEIPTPMVHEGDGGRYLATWAIEICRDPDSDWVNWGTYRFMVHNERVLAGYPRSNSQFGRILKDKYVPKKQNMPVAIVIGVDPLCNAAACMSYPMGVSEVNIAGGIRGESVSLVKCETSDLLVPATAEMVIEGEVLIDAVVSEGPFGEFPGFRSGEMSQGIAFRVNAITYRKNPIITLSCVGPKDETSVVTSVGAALNIKKRLQKYGVPVTDVHVPRESAVHMAVVGVRKGGKEVAQKVLEALVLTVRRADISKIIVVDDDIDVFDMEEVTHEFATKCHPGRGILIAEYEGKSQTLTPAYSQEERMTYSGASVVFDVTWPQEWDKMAEVPVRASFNCTYPKELQDKVLSRWEHLMKKGVK